MQAKLAASSVGVHTLAFRVLLGNSLGHRSYVVAQQPRLKRGLLVESRRSGNNELLRVARIIGISPLILYPWFLATTKLPNQTSDFIYHLWANTRERPEER